MNDGLDIDHEWEIEQATFRGRTEALLARMKLLREQAENDPQYFDTPDPE